MMILRELHLKAFGKYKNKTVTLREGLNLITGPNESGKTTLHAFIRGMLYGIRRQRGRAAQRDTYSRYLPWEDEGVYGGMIRLESGGKIFRLTRSFLGNREPELVCETDGEKLSVEQGDLDMLLGNVGEAVFDNTLSIGQLRAAPDETLATALKNHMVNYQEGSFGITDVEGALKRLKKKYRELDQQKKMEEQTFRVRIEKQAERLRYLEEEHERLRDAVGSLNDAAMILSEQREDQKEPEKDNRGRGSIAWFMRWAALLFLIIGIILWKQPLLLLGCIVAAAACVFFCFRMNGKTQKKMSSGYEEKRQQSLKQRKQWEKERREEALKEKTKEIEEQREVVRGLQQQLLAFQESDEELRAVDLAMRTIRELAGSRQSTLGGVLQKRTSEIFSEITGGRYRGLHISEKLEIGIDTGAAYVTPEQLSRGTLEQIYLAFRLAAGELLCEEEKLPILLDDTFVMYDEERLAQVLQWLLSCGHQVLLFTCQRREEQLLCRLRLPFHKIDLESL